MSVQEHDELWSRYAAAYEATVKHSAEYWHLIDCVVEMVKGRKNCLDLGAGTGNGAIRLLEADSSRKVWAVEKNEGMIDVLREKAGWTLREARQVFSINENANMMIDTTVGIQGLREVKQHISGGFQWALGSGPLAGEIVRGLLVDMVDIRLHEDPVHRGPAQMMPAVRQALFAGILSADPTLLEPIYKIQVRVPAIEMGNVTGLLSRKRGSIHSVEQDGPIVNVIGMVPVSETLGFSQEMRAATSGTAFWQMTFDHWSPVPDSMLLDLVKKIRMRKGLSPDPPRASEYIVRE